MADQVQESADRGQESADQGQESNMADQHDGPSGKFPNIPITVKK